MLKIEYSKLKGKKSIQIFLNNFNLQFRQLHFILDLTAYYRVGETNINKINKPCVLVLTKSNEVFPTNK